MCLLFCCVRALPLPSTCCGVVGIPHHRSLFHAGLGYGFNIAGLNLKNAPSWLSAGSTVFDLATHPTCVSVSSVGEVSYAYTFYQDQSEFASSLGISTDVSVGYAGLFSASSTVSTAFSSASTTSTSLRSASLVQSNILATTSVDATCLPMQSAYNAEFIRDFQVRLMPSEASACAWCVCARARARLGVDCVIPSSSGRARSLSVMRVTACVSE